MNFMQLPEIPKLTLKNVTVPACLLDQPGDLVTTDLMIEGGRITADPGIPVDMRRAMVFPAFVDVHTHLDKGHIQPRCPNPDGTFGGALTATAADRAERWDARDVGRRMDFALRTAWAHGTRAIRTHLDSVARQHRVSFGVFRELRAEWAGRIELQAANLCGIEQVADRRAFNEIADEVAASGGVLGAVVRPNRELRAWLRFFFATAERRGLAADLHVDETGDASVATLREVAQTVLDTSFGAPVMVGHCCSLAVQPEPQALATLDLVARAGLHVVSLPMCNVYLQDRVPGRTPRWRGITLLHEMKARGIRVAFASDNTRDPFHAYGDLDMLEVMREATRIGHLDHSDTDWIHSFLANPAAAAGFAAPSLSAGAPADLVICSARNWSELFARPQADRIVMRDGRPIERRLPAYAELDDLMEGA